MKHHLVPLFLAVIALPYAAPAQATFLWSPAGSNLTGGGLGNPGPFWALSATYQQVHDHSEMMQVNGGAPIVMKGIAFRAYKTNAWTARSMDVQINMGGTGVTSQNISSTFSTNLGSNPVRVVGNSQNPFQRFSFPAFTGKGDPNPAGLIVPFKTSWVWLTIKNNNLCWEWRHKNATISQPTALDGFNGVAPGGVLLPNVGVGCLPTGGTTRSHAVISKLGAFSGGRMNITLQYAAANARALMMAGIKKQWTPLPGWCSSLELVPVVHLYGQTGATGLWNYPVPVTVFSGVSTFDLLVQYAFLDKGLPGGVGLSDMAVYRTPPGGTWHISRVQNPNSANSNSGNEKATLGAVNKNVGLVTGFQIK